MKRFLLIAVIGGFVAMGIASWAAVPALAWYNQAADPNALCNCGITVRRTTIQFLRWQGIGFVFGALGAVFFRYVLFKKKKGASTEQMLDL